ncbi:MAG: cystathionine gamma-synthase [Smithellaceae bacterium]|nr:cystathionine gamma-synthase [Smithellaceae bacterium]
MKFNTRAIHTGQDADPTTGATIQPIHPSSTFTQEEIGKFKSYEYSRSGNPTRKALETCLASLENGKYCCAFSSGMAAISSVLSLLVPGDHAIATEDLYGGSYRIFEWYRTHYGINFTYVNGNDSDNFARAITPATKLIWIETPSNPLTHIVDIAAVAKICRDYSVFLVADNTFASPYLQQPLILGARIVVHSTTKYINGHSDVVGGAVITNDLEIQKALGYYQNMAGAVPGPFDCWLTLRGLKTLSVRMKQHQANALQIATFLRRHPFVEAVHYPGLPDHPQHDLAKKQMSGFGGMVSFRIRGGREEANRFFKSLKVFSFAESLGAVESLACYPAVMTHAAIPKEKREKRGITDGTIRLSVGIEDSEDLINDLMNALDVAQRTA